MTTTRQLNSVSPFQHPALQIISLVVVKVDPQLAFADKKNFLGVVDFPPHRIMGMGGDFLTGRMLNIGELL